LETGTRIATVFDGGFGWQGGTNSLVIRPNISDRARTIRSGNRGFAKHLDLFHQDADLAAAFNCANAPVVTSSLTSDPILPFGRDA
jgi:hypothetical protein